MSNIVTVDPADVAGGRVELATFPSKVAALDTLGYVGKHIQLKGCAPTWAHLLVAARLIPVAAAVDFVVDDRAGGKIVEVFRKESR